jgi:hypothetical protein
MDNEGENSLDNILSDEPAVEAPVVEAAPETPQETEEAPSGPERDEMGRFVSTKGVEETPETVPPTDKLPQEEYKAIREEREKRQAAEARLAALEQQFQQLQQPKEPPPAPPNIWDDEQAALAHNRQQAVTEATFMARLDMSEMLASQAHEDFDAMKGKFIEMMNANPALQQEALSAKHPWEKAYQIAKNAASAAELGATNVEELEAKLREKIMAELQQGQTLVQPQVQLPPSLTGERNVGNRSGPAWTGPPPLEDLLA